LDYNSSVAWIGLEVEKTPAYGTKTLFISGIQPIDIIKNLATTHECQHIYLGANMSFDPSVSDAWDSMIKSVLELELLTTLDFDIKHIRWVLQGGYAENHNFIPQISVKIPCINQLGYNATLKIDDSGFDATNPGVWCHLLNELTTRKVFTPWNKYKEDLPL